MKITSLPSRAPRPRSGRLFGMTITVAIAGLLVSCGSQSVHPLATPADTSLDARLRGTWLLATYPQDSLHYARVDFDSELGPVFSVLDTASLQKAKLKFVRLGEHWFVDVQLMSWEHSPGWLRATAIDSMKLQHGILRLEWDSDTITARGFAAWALVDYNKRHPWQVGMKVVSYYSTDVTLTDATPKLRRFVASVADADSMFNNGLRFVRQR